MSMSDEDDEPFKYKSLLQQQRSASQELSCVSIKSDKSMDFPLKFKDGKSSDSQRGKTHGLLQKQRSYPPNLSSVSMKSDKSMDFPLKFENGKSSELQQRKTHGLLQKQRSYPPNLSSVSMKSDKSMDFPLKFENGKSSESQQRKTHGLLQKQRSYPPNLSSVSLRSDKSMDFPLKFENGKSSELQQRKTHGLLQKQRSYPPNLSSVSMKSDKSMDFPLKFENGKSSESQQRKTHGLLQKQRSYPSNLSSVSMRSDKSMDFPLKFENGKSSELQQRKTHGLLQKQRSYPPNLSSVSMKSDKSMDFPLKFENGKSSESQQRKTHGLLQKQRSYPSNLSSVSMRSDKSMDFPLKFENGKSSELQQRKTHGLLQKQRSYPPNLSSVSMKSDKSMDFPLKFENGKSSESQQRKTHGLLQKQRSYPPNLSSVSMRSDKSMDFPLKFENGKSSELQQRKTHGLLQKQRSDPPVLSCVSMKSHKSMDFPLKFADGKSSESQRDSHTKAGVKQSQLKQSHANGRHSDTTIKEPEHILLSSEVTAVYQQRFKSQMQKKCQIINEPGTSAPLNMIYTELFITEGGSGEMNYEHEVIQIEAASTRAATKDTPIQCNDIFKPLHDKAIRTMLTKGFAGIGKTVSVQKFILDWAEGNANQDIDFIFPLPFRELNLIKQKNMSLIELLCQFFPDIKELTPEDFYQYRVMFILDSVDESRLPLDFQNNRSICDVTESAPVDVLLTNLIKRNLLPSALLWITSRPAAANQIPVECVDQVTEIRGFSDPLKEEYFRKRILNQNLASKVIKHIKSSRSLYIMCHMPVFCWISATVLERMLDEAESGEIPKTLTQMFTQFLIYQTNLSKQKYLDSGPGLISKSILALGKLAFQQLDKDNLIFYEEDLRECGIDIKEASVYSGICTQVFIEEYALHSKKVYSFVHLTVQEHLAALYAFLSFINKNVDQQTLGFLRFSEKTTMSEFLKSAVDKALQCRNGHLDLFLRFLLGLSMESNQSVLRSLLMQKEHESNEDIITYIKEKIQDDPVPERCINLFHCLNEMNDFVLVQEVQKYLSRRKRQRFHGVDLSPAQWSALVFLILNSDEELEEFNLWNYESTEECLLKLLPVVKASRTALLAESNLTEKSCAALASILSSTSSCLKELDLSNNNLQDSGVRFLSTGLRSPHCKLEILRLGECNLTEESCAVLTSALSSNPSHLKELRLSRNKLQNSGVKLLSAALENPKCKLETLRLNSCSITEEGCVALTSALKSNPSHLRYLDIGRNNLGQLGGKLLSELLADSRCRVEILKLFDCCIAEESYACLISALKSNPSHLRELDLGWNKPRTSDVKLLSSLLADPKCKLEILKLHESSITAEGFLVLAEALKSNPLYMRELDLSYNKPGESGEKLLFDLVNDKTLTLRKLE